MADGKKTGEMMAFITDKNGKRCHIGNWVRITIVYSMNNVEHENVFVDELTKICNSNSIEMKRRNADGNGGLWIGQWIGGQKAVTVEKLTKEQAMLAMLEE